MECNKEVSHGCRSCGEEHKTPAIDRSDKFL